MNMCECLGGSFVSRVEEMDDSGEMTIVTFMSDTA